MYLLILFHFLFFLFFVLAKRILSQRLHLCKGSRVFPETRCPYYKATVSNGQKVTKPALLQSLLWNKRRSLWAVERRAHNREVYEVTSLWTACINWVDLPSLQACWIASIKQYENILLRAAICVGRILFYCSVWRSGNVWEGEDSKWL